MFLKKFLAALAFCAIFFWGAAPPVSAETAAESAKPEISAEAAVVCCVNTGQVLYAKNADEQLAMASTTKIMTSLLTLEAAAADNKLVTVTDEMVAVEGSSMGLAGGDQIRLRELAVGMLLASGNDAANAAAIAVGGSQEGFAALMNQRARELGMDRTHFVTPSGLDDDGHYSTAMDLARLASAAICNESFRAICSKAALTVAFEHPSKTVSLTNHNRLLKLYSGCIGVKTGYTKKAGRCLVSAAERDGVLLVAVTLRDPNDWNDHQALLDYGFAQLETVPLGEASFSLPVVGGAVPTVTAAGAPEEDALVVARGQTVARTVRLPRFVYAPVEQGTVLGSITFTVAGETVKTIPLAATEAVAAAAEPAPWQRAGQWLVRLFS